MNILKQASKNIIAALILIAPPAAAARTVPAADSHIRWQGRYLTEADSTVRFNFPGVAARLNFSGPSLTMEVKPGSGYFVAEIDDNPPEKLFVPSNDSILVLADGLSDGSHSARVTYAIEGYEFNPVVRSFTADSFLQAPPCPELKIEFIGNSITCGYGTEVNDPNIHFAYDNENHTKTFAALTARALGAEANIVARSGIGVYRNYGDKRTGSTEKTMPLEYGHALLYQQEPWDFSRFRPDIICINLGTNDVSCNDYEIDLYHKAMDSFVKSVEKLNPGAKIILLSGSMLNGNALADVRAALDDVAARHPGVLRFDFTPADGSLGYGADWHPSQARAKVMAEELTAFIRANCL